MLTAKSDEPSLAANMQQAGRNRMEQIPSSPWASENTWPDSRDLRRASQFNPVIDKRKDWSII